MWVLASFPSQSLMPIPSVIVQPGLLSSNSHIMIGSISHFHKSLLFCTMSDIFQWQTQISLCHTSARQRITIFLHQGRTDSEKYTEQQGRSAAEPGPEPSFHHLQTRTSDQTIPPSFTSLYPLLIPINILSFPMTCKLTFSLLVVLLHNPHPVWLRPNSGFASNTTDIGFDISSHCYTSNQNTALVMA